MANSEYTHPSRKILLVVTTGGFTHAGKTHLHPNPSSGPGLTISSTSPVFEIGAVLAARGHAIEFSTLEGQEGWVQGYDFITKVHFLGPGPTPEQMNAHYLRMRTWDISKGISGSMESKYLFDSFWPQTYRGLKATMDDPEARPAMMIADFFVDAFKDIHVEYKLPIAQVWPQMPFLMMPCSYIPVQPGFQLEGTLSSENASLWLRLKNELVVVFGLPAIFKWLRWTKQMRLNNGVTYPTHRIQKPDYLIFINSFFGLEIPRDLPPTCAPVGPLISDTYASLNEECEGFFKQHSKVIYIALGTHIILTNADAAKIVHGLLRLMEEGLIDGVIWSISENGRQDLDVNTTFLLKTPSGERKSHRLGDLLSGRNPDWLFSLFVPQRAVLDHHSTRIYLTHGGGSSANEGLFHGKPMLAMGVFMDQISNTARLVAGGIAEPLNKFHFTSEELYTKAKKILADKGGSYERNSLRLMRIARVASRRKHHAADLIEELMYDTELRFMDGKELRPMHLQTADMRMPVWKANNWDLLAVSSLGLGAVSAAFGIVGRMLWLHRGVLTEVPKAVLKSSTWLVSFVH